MATSLLDLYKTAEEEAKLSNLSRMKQASKIRKNLIERYQPGGAFGRGYEAILAGQKTRDIGRTAQRDISRGLYGIRPYGAEWEATVGAPARLKLEDIRMERLSEAQQSFASFIEGISTPYPDFSGLIQAYQAQAAAPSEGGGGGGYGSYESPYGSWAMQSRLGGGGGGPTYAPGQSPLQQQLAARNAARATTTPYGGGGTAISGNQGLTPTEAYTPSGPTTTAAPATTIATAGTTGTKISGQLGGTGKLSTWEAVKKMYPNARITGTAANGRKLWEATA